MSFRHYGMINSASKCLKTILKVIKFSKQTKFPQKFKFRGYPPVNHLRGGLIPHPPLAETLKALYIFVVHGTFEFLTFSKTICSSCVLFLNPELYYCPTFLLPAGIGPWLYLFQLKTKEPISCSKCLPGSRIHGIRPAGTTTNGSTVFCVFGQKFLRIVSFEEKSSR
jgi:hypothetical protein